MHSALPASTTLPPLETTAPPERASVDGDWAAADTWLSAVQMRSKNGSTQTAQTYRHHLNKLRWYCDNVAQLSLSKWTVQDAIRYIQFLENMPQDAFCASGARSGMAGWSPFKIQPSPSSQADMRRCLSAMLSDWVKTGYIERSPMTTLGSGAKREVNIHRSVNLDLFASVLTVMDDTPKATFAQRQLYLRDSFILQALRGLGLRASELVAASMNAFSQVTLQSNGQRYWIFTVTKESAKGGVARPIPVPPAVWTALLDYRQAFGLPAQPLPGDTTRLILSPRTTQVVIGARQVKRVNDRRFFNAWREVKTRQGLYKIVTERFRDTALILEKSGDVAAAQVLNMASTHWLRHTFAKASLLSGHSMRSVAAALGHADLRTTMIYTNQEAQDLIVAWESVNAGSVASEHTTPASSDQTDNSRNTILTK